MKKWIGFFTLLAVLGVPSTGWAKEDPAAAAAKRAEQKKLVEAKKAELNGSEWKVSMSSSDPSAKPEEDLWTFQNNQVRSQQLSNRGFVPTNYTVTVEPGNDWAVWETMQTSQKEGVVFIRGEWFKDEMRGAISQQMEGGQMRDYNFKTIGKVAVPPTTPKPVKKEEPKKEAPVAEEKPVSAESAAPADGAAAAAVTDKVGSATDASTAADKAVEKATEAPTSVAEAPKTEAPKTVQKKKKRWGF